MNIQWKRNIYNSIKDFADLTKQKELWLKVGSNYASSFDEDISLLFDSFCFDEFIEEWRLNNYNRELLKLMSEFRDLLNTYKKKDSEELILKDPAWLVIVNKAKEIIKNWDNSR